MKTAMGIVIAPAINPIMLATILRLIVLPPF